MTEKQQTETKKEEVTKLEKLGKQKKVTVQGVEYTLQFPGVRHAQKILDASQIRPGVYNDEIYNGLIMEDVIVEPKINWDYWDENLGYRELMREADRFLGEGLN